MIRISSLIAIKRFWRFRMKTFLFSFCFFLAFFSARLAEASEPLVVHVLVGERIDKSERDLYGLFPGVLNFHSAAFFRTDSNAIVLELESSSDQGISSKIYPVSLFLVEEIRKQIDLTSSEQRFPKPDIVTFNDIEREQKRGKELFPGYAGSLFGGWITLLFAYGLNPDHDPSKLETYLVWGTGSAFFSALGVQKAGEFDDGSRTLGASFLGGLVGSAVGIMALEGSLQIENPGLVAMVIFFAKPLLTSYGAIRGYYAAAKSKHKGMLNLGKANLKFSFPDVRVATVESPLSVRKMVAVYKISLLNIEF